MGQGDWEDRPQCGAVHARPWLRLALLHRDQLAENRSGSRGQAAFHLWRHGRLLPQPLRVRSRGLPRAQVQAGLWGFILLGPSGERPRVAGHDEGRPDQDDRGAHSEDRAAGRAYGCLALQIGWRRGALRQSTMRRARRRGPRTPPSTSRRRDPTSRPFLTAGTLSDARDGPRGFVVAQRSHRLHLPVALDRVCASADSRANCPRPGSSPYSATTEDVRPPVNLRPPSTSRGRGLEVLLREPDGSFQRVTGEIRTDVPRDEISTCPTAMVWRPPKQSSLRV